MYPSIPKHVNSLQYSLFDFDVDIFFDIADWVKCSIGVYRGCKTTSTLQIRCEDDLDFLIHGDKQEVRRRYRNSVQSLFQSISVY